MTATTSLAVHHALRAAHDTGLPIRAILGQWTRELGVKGGVAVFPGPRNSPGNVTTAHVGRVCGYLEGGSATERHKFPVFCSPAEGVKEYDWYFNNLSYYDHIADQAAGDWVKACNLIERSPWSSDHYGGTLDSTARSLTIKVVTPTVDLANVRAKPSRSSSVVGKIGRRGKLAYSATVTGEVIGGNGRWFRVRIGSGNGRTGYIHDSVANVINL